MTNSRAEDFTREVCIIHYPTLPSTIRAVNGSYSNTVQVLLGQIEIFNCGNNCLFLLDLDNHSSILSCSPNIMLLSFHPS